MDPELSQILRSILDKYKKFKDTERYYLIYLNTPTENDLQLPEYKISQIPQVNYEIEIPESIVKPFTTTFIRTPINIASKEKEHLDFLPYDEINNIVHYSPDFEVFKTTPFNQDAHRSEFVLNTQFYEYMILSLIKSYPLTQDWIHVSNTIADSLNKSRRLMMSIFTSTINKYFNNAETELKKQEFKDNFCQMCMRYACATHFYDDKVEYDSDNQDIEENMLREQYKDDAILTIDPDNWKTIWWSNQKNVLKTGRWFNGYKCFDSMTCSKTTINMNKPIKPIQKQIIKKLLKMGLNNSCAIALFVELECKCTAPYLQKYSEKYVPPTLPTPLPKKVFYTSIFDYKNYIVNVIEAHCKCKGECTIKGKCPCLIGETVNGKVVARRCCEKYCLCSTDCKQRFLGCSCKYGKCDSRTCVCKANLRECDPELCIFCHSAFTLAKKPIKAITTKKKERLLCRNMKNQLRFIKKTAISESGIRNAGMGLYVLENCDKGDYITEYTGELIREAESERRAATYDYKHHSYIFSLSPDIRWSIDSTNFGSKMRYVNHRSHQEQNTYAQVWSVEGQLKILLFAQEKIISGQELFFDYGYDCNEIKYEWLQEYERRFKNKKPKI